MGRPRVVVALVAAVLMVPLPALAAPASSDAQAPANAQAPADAQAPANAQGPADAQAPPAPGEAAPLLDPSEPLVDRGALGFAAAAVVELGDLTFGPQAVETLAGDTRTATAVAASAAGWPAGAGAAVVASGDDFPDALAAASLAGTVGGPLLLTPRGGLDGAVAGELLRLGVTRVYAVGGLETATVLGLTADQRSVGWIRGTDRYDTAFLVARAAVALGAETSTALVASGEHFADALSASALAAGLRVPLLLTPRDGLGPRLAEEVAALGVPGLWVVGGGDAVSDAAVAGLPVDRVAGGDRYETSALIAARGFHFGLTGQPVLAGGQDFPDGLAGGVLAGGARHAPLVVTAREDLSLSAAALLDGLGHAGITVLGGRAAISTFVHCQLSAGSQRPFLCAEQELTRQGYHMGAVDGAPDTQARFGLYAFEKVAGLRPDGRFGETEWRRMLEAPTLAPRRTDLPADHIELDIGRQLILVVRGGLVSRVFHTSTGKSSTPTVRGVFTVYEKRNVRQANRMYRPVFWHRGYAFHGYPEVPLYAASHGCARMYDGDMDLLWSELWVGERVASY